MSATIQRPASATPTAGFLPICSTSGAMLRGAVAVSLMYWKSSLAQATNHQQANYSGATGGIQFVIPAGMKLDIYALSMQCGSIGGAAQTVDAEIYVAGSDVTAAALGSATACRASTGTPASATALASPFPYTVDATGGNVLIDVRFSASATTGSFLGSGTILGCLYKP